MTAHAGKLTAVAIRNAAPADKPARLFDGLGLYLEVMPTGARYWRMKYRYGGKERRLAFGVFPEVSLANARSRCHAARDLLRDGRDPAAERKAEHRRSRIAAANTFGAIAGEWLDTQRGKLAPITTAKAQWMLDMARALDARPIAEITAAEILDVVREVEKRGTHETAHRLKQRIGQVFRYAIVTERAERDPTGDLRGALVPINTTSRAAVTDPTAVANLLQAIGSYQGQPTTAAALALAPLVFARPGNLRAMEWTEIDFDAAEWRIPAGKMKMREAHVVPLATQAVAILRALQPLTGRGRYVFPSLRTGSRPMSENTVNAALRRLGFDKDTMTGHGFRAMASTRLNEMGWAPDIIERQLAHAERNKVRAAYNRAQYIGERRRMMQAWADYLDGLQTGANVTSIKHKAG
jgi:integrase